MSEQIKTNSRLAGEAESIAKRQVMFAVETPRRKLADLIVQPETGAQISAVLTKIRHRKLLYEEFGLKEIDPSGGRTAVNFYGPPGTGKTLAAEALAGELGMGIIRANYAEIESKFVGETPKNIKAAFGKAKAENALLFFDEADSILGKRLTNITQSTDHAVNVSRSVMLIELDQFDGVVVFATNLAANYDAAFTRRILAHIAMPLPAAAGRLRLWQRHIPAKLPVELDPGDWERLATESEGLAGGDILNAVINAAAAAVERGGSQARVVVEDLLAALEAGRQAKAAVGAPFIREAKPAMKDS